MSIALVSSRAQDLTAGNPTSSITTTGANLLVVGASWFEAPQPSLQDSVTTPSGNNNARLSGGSSAPGFIRQSEFFGTANLDSYYVSAPAVGAGHTFTPTVNNAALSIGAWSGVQATSPLDQQNGLGGQLNVTTAQPGSITPTADNCLIVVLVYFESGTVTGIDSGMTVIAQAVGGSGTAIAWKQQATAAAINPTVTFDSNQSRAGCQIFSFFPAAETGAVALSTAPASATWSVPPALALSASPLALTAAPAAATWTVPALALASGARALTTAPALATWLVPTLTLSPAALALTAVVPATTWSVPPRTLSVSGAGALTLTAPALATWRASSRSLTGGVALGGGGDQALTRLGLEIGAEVQSTPRLGGGSIQ